MARRKSLGSFDPSTMAEGAPPAMADSLVRGMGLQFDLNSEALGDALHYGMGPDQLIALLGNYQQAKQRAVEAKERNDASMIQSFNQGVGHISSSQTQAGSGIERQRLENEGRLATEQERTRGSMSAAEQRAIAMYLASVNRANTAETVQRMKNEQAGMKPPKLDDKETAQRILMEVKKENAAAGKKMSAAEEKVEVLNRWKRASEAAQSKMGGSGGGTTGGPGGVSTGNEPMMLNASVDPERITGGRFPDIATLSQRPDPPMDRGGWYPNWNLKGGENVPQTEKRMVTPNLGPYKDDVVDGRYNRETQTALSQQFKDLAKRYQFDDMGNIMGEVPSLRIPDAVSDARFKRRYIQPQRDAERATNTPTAIPEPSLPWSGGDVHGAAITDNSNADQPTDLASALRSSSENFKRKIANIQIPGQANTFGERLAKKGPMGGGIFSAPKTVYDLLDALLSRY